MSVHPQNTRLSTNPSPTVLVLLLSLARVCEDNPKPITQLLEEADAIRDTVGSTTLDKASTKRS